MHHTPMVSKYVPFFHVKHTSASATYSTNAYALCFPARRRDQNRHQCSTMAETRCWTGVRDSDIYTIFLHFLLIRKQQSIYHVQIVALSTIESFPRTTSGQAEKGAKVDAIGPPSSVEQYLSDILVETADSSSNDVNGVLSFSVALARPMTDASC